MSEEEVGRILERLAARAQPLRTFLRHLPQSRRKLRAFKSGLLELGVLQDGLGVCFLSCLEKHSLPIPGLAIVEDELETRVLVFSDLKFLHCFALRISLPFR